MTVPPPPGFELEPRDPNLFKPLIDAGAIPTNGFRTPTDIERLRREGYKPASNSLHLDGDAVDLTPGKSGLSLNELRRRAAAIAGMWPGARVINEGDHVHAQLPGWGMAPGTPGTPNSGLPPFPQGFELHQRGSLKANNVASAPLVASGRNHDGDTFALTDGRNARLSGVDAFELTQQGRTLSGQPMPLGLPGRDLLASYALPGTPAAATGAMTYGRPVATLGDAGNALLRQGLAVASPQFLTADPLKLKGYMEAERDARLNRRGAFAGKFQTPDSFRHDGPWADAEFVKRGSNGIAVFNDEPLPFQGLRPDIAKGYSAIFLNMKSKPEDALAYAKANGFDIDPETNRKRFAERDKVHAARGTISYITPPRVLTDPGDGKLGTTVRGFADPFNALDELGGVADTFGLTAGRENLFGSDRRFGDILANNVDQNRSIIAHDEATHPYYRMGGQLASGIAMPIGGGARTALQLGKLGAIEGGLAGFGAGEGWADRFRNGTLGAVVGGAGGAALGGAIGGASSVLGRMRGRAVGDAVREGGFEAAPIVEDGLQNAGPTPAARFQPNASMRMEDGAPQLVGPRQPDVIDIADHPPLPEGYSLDPFGKTRPIGDRLGADEVAALFREADPRSVIPRPGNEVSSIEEAALVNPGSIRDVEAPDETSYLGVRKVPSPLDPSRFNRVRGPLDITQRIRSLGGVRDDGGELNYLGLGAPRKLAFGGNESFLGKLVNNETGMPLDYAGLRLWEEGYFPHLTERPTIDDVLTALGDENRGARNFLPEDMEEAAHYESALADRYKIESARDDGRPLAEQVGHEISLDDLERNTPPVEAYDERPRLTGMVGNINLDRLEKPGDVAQLLDHVGKRVGGFSAAARGKVTHDETQALAKELNLTPEALLKRQHGQALNAEQAFAARNILQASSVAVGKLARRALGGADTDLSAFRNALIQHAAIQEQVTGATAEAGRALSQFRMTAQAGQANAKALREFLSEQGTGDNLRITAQRVIDLMGVDPAKANAFVRDVIKPTWKDKAVELYYNSLLSGPQTHAVNIVSNAVTAALSIPEHVGAAALGAFRPGSTDKVFGSEIGQRIVGLMQGARDGLSAARYTFKTGKVPDHVAKVEAAQQEAIPGKLGHVLRTPTRALSAEDEFFKAVARRSELASLSVRKANGEGLTGDALKARVAELSSSPDSGMIDRAADFARYQTFQRQTGVVAQGLQNMTRKHPWLKLVAPFIRTPTNLLKYAGERSPAAPLLQDWRADFVAGGARRDLAIARATMGTGLGITVADLAGKGLVTGGGPSDDNARRALMADGWQPYSIKVGDKYFSYQRLDPLASTLGIAADYVDKQSAMTDRQRDEKAMILTASIINNLASKTWLSGLSDLVQTLSDAQRYGPSYIRRVVAGVATPAASAQLARTIDPTQRETNTVADAVMARVPGLSTHLMPKLDVWGDPIVTDGGVGPDIVSPVYQSTRDHKAVNEEALRLGLKVTVPTRDVAGKRLSDEDYHAYRSEAGHRLAAAFTGLIGSDKWRSMADDQKRTAFDHLKADSRKAARETLGMVEAMKQAPRRASALSRVARPSTASQPLPPGFELAR